MRQAILVNNKKIILSIGILGILALSIFTMSCKMRKQTEQFEELIDGLPANSPLPGGLTEEYKQVYLKTNEWLNDKLKEWKPTEYRKMHFIGLHLPLTGALRDWTTEEDDIRFLEMLEEAGVDVFSVGVIPPEDLDEEMLKRYDRVFEEAREKGMKIKIWIRSNEYPWFQREEKIISGVREVIKRWNPDYLAIIHEPKAENKDFIKEIVQKAAREAKSLNPKIKVSATVINSKKGIDYVDVFVQIPELDIVGFDIYNLWGLCEDCPGGDIIEEKIKLIHSKGKEAWIEEFWLSTQWNRATPEPTDMTPGFNHPNRAFWDAKFIKVITYFAQKNNLKGIEPWFTTYFVLYPEMENIWEFEGGKQIPKAEYLKKFKNALLNKNRTPTFYAYKEVIEEVKKKASEISQDVLQTPNISHVKVAIVYETIIDQIRDAKEIEKIVKDLNTNLIFRGFFRWRGMAKFEYKYDVYGTLKKNISLLKKDNPNLIFVGALAAQELNRIDYDPFTKKIIPKEKVWEMALDPQKYGFNLSKEELHRKYWEITKDENYIFPDILNPEFQELLLNFAKAQIDAGVDAIWIDGLFWQAKMFAKLANSTNHSAVKDILEATKRIVEEIKMYGKSKGKRIYVGSWAQTAFPYPMPELDFVTVSPSSEEIRKGKLDETKWIKKIKKIRETYGDVPIIAFIDWAFTTDTPLGVFSQELTKEKQREVLMSFDKFFTENGIIFAYPVHGRIYGKGCNQACFWQVWKI